MIQEQAKPNANASAEPGEQARDGGLPAEAKQDADAELQQQDDTAAGQVGQRAAGEHG